MIKLEHIKKSFGRHEVLRDVNLEVNTGEVVVILGPSGSGKTTLLRSINFLEPADKGKITVGDLTVDAKKASHKEILALRHGDGLPAVQSLQKHDRLGKRHRGSGNRKGD